MTDNLLARFEDYIGEHSFFSRDDRILAAVSGGVDSMVMLDLLVRAGYRVGVAHVNFQLRGQEADEDEVMVRQTAEKYGVPFYNMRFDTMAETERTGESVQMAARRLRYDWFDELCAGEGYTAIAIAHHVDDSIETFFINMLRGTGLRGLTGIAVAHGRVVRPLLFASRKDILDYAAKHEIPFREDSSNHSTKYLRNKIRLGLIPRIREMNPRFTEVMSENVSRLTDAQAFINHGIERIRDEAQRQDGGLTTIDPGKIDPGFPVRFVVYEMLTSYGFRGPVVDSLLRSLEGGGSGKKFYARDFVAYVDRGKIVVAPIDEDDPCEVEMSMEAGKAYCGNSVYVFDVIDIDQLDMLIQPENVALLDADKVAFPLKARRWREGDWFVPLGMEGRKKVSDFLVDAKVSLAEKQRQFVITSGEDIVWLAGRRIDDRFKVGTDTENVLRIVKEII